MSASQSGGWPRFACLLSGSFAVVRPRRPIGQKVAMKLLEQKRSPDRPEWTDRQTELSGYSKVKVRKTKGSRLNRLKRLCWSDLKCSKRPLFASASSFWGSPGST